MAAAPSTGDAVICIWKYLEGMAEGEEFYAQDLGGNTYHFRKWYGKLQRWTWVQYYGYCWADYNEKSWHGGVQAMSSGIEVGTQTDDMSYARNCGRCRLLLG